jgi:hypothetical protein
MTTPLIGWSIVGSSTDACELKKVMLVNTKAIKKDKINTLLNKIKTIEIRSQNDLISITNILSLHDRGVRFN